MGIFFSKKENNEILNKEELINKKENNEILNKEELINKVYNNFILNIDTINKVFENCIDITNFKKNWTNSLFSNKNNTFLITIEKYNKDNIIINKTNNDFTNYKIQSEITYRIIPEFETNLNNILTINKLKNPLLHNEYYFEYLKKLKNDCTEYYFNEFSKKKYNSICQFINLTIIEYYKLVEINNEIKLIYSDFKKYFEEFKKNIERDFKNIFDFSNIHKLNYEYDQIIKNLNQEKFFILEPFIKTIIRYIGTNTSCLNNFFLENYTNIINIKNLKSLLDYLNKLKLNLIDYINKNSKNKKLIKYINEVFEFSITNDLYNIYILKMDIMLFLYIIKNKYRIINSKIDENFFILNKKYFLFNKLIY